MTYPTRLRVSAVILTVVGGLLLLYAFCEADDALAELAERPGQGAETAGWSEPFQAYDFGLHYDPIAWEWGNKHRRHAGYSIIGGGCVALALAMGLLSGLLQPTREPRWTESPRAQATAAPGDKQDERFVEQARSLWHPGRGGS